METIKQTQKEEQLPKDDVTVFEQDSLFLLPDHLRVAVYAAEAELKRLGIYGVYRVVKISEKNVPYDQVRR